MALQSLFFTVGEGWLKVLNPSSSAYLDAIQYLPWISQGLDKASAPGDLGRFRVCQMGERFHESRAVPNRPLHRTFFWGRVAIVLAAQHPDLVDRLALVDCAGLKPKQTLRSQFRIRLFKTLRKAVPLVPTLRWRESFRTTLYSHFGSADYKDAGAMRPIFVRVVNQDLRALLPNIQAATLLVWGEKDEDVPVTNGMIMAQEIPDARLEILAGAGHFSYLDRLPKFCQLAQDFFQENIN